MRFAHFHLCHCACECSAAQAPANVCAGRQVSFLSDEEAIERVRSWRAAATAVDSLSGLTAALRSLNDLLCDILDSASKSEETRVDLGEWRGEGHEWIGKRLRRPVQGRPGRATIFVNATVVGWLSAEESDFIDELNVPAPLWHVVWDDGEEEDLEEAEVPRHDLVTPISNLVRVLAYRCAYVRESS
jgi:hypothetical protein